MTVIESDYTERYTQGLPLQEETCKCTTKHVPKPIGYIETDGVWLCPTSACNLGQLVLEWGRYGGEPPGYVTKHYSSYIRNLAKEKYESE